VEESAGEADDDGTRIQPVKAFVIRQPFCAAVLDALRETGGGESELEGPEIQSARCGAAPPPPKWGHQRPRFEEPNACSAVPVPVFQRTGAASLVKEPGASSGQ